MSIVEHLLARLTTLPDHPHFVGAPIDLEGLDGIQLGSIWLALRKALWFPDYDDPREVFARWLQKQIEELELTPVFDDNAGLAVFRDIKAGAWADALKHLPFLAQRPTPELQCELVRIMSKRPDPHLSGGEYQAYALGYFAGGHGLAELREEVAKRYSDSPCRLREFDVLDKLGPAALLALAGTYDGYFVATRFGLDKPDPAVVLAEEPGYVDFPREMLVFAVERIADVQSGKVPYKADGAFTKDDAQVISRAARIAAYRDEPWLRPTIGPLMVGCCVAPTSAKTAPSQSLAITLGHSIEEIPTPESVRALRDALAAVRHLGIKKKLARNLKPAERGLGERPNIALRMTIGAKPDKKQQAMLATCMESGFTLGMALSYAEWRERLVDAPAGAAFATNVVWLERRSDGNIQSFMMEIAKSGVSMTSLDGTPCSVDATSSISLWHPLLADEGERRGWQRIFLTRKIKQPIRQVFREYYVPGMEDLDKSTFSMFEDHILSVRTLIGLARREGWCISKYDGLTRRFGDVRVTFSVAADLYPGAGGYGTSGKLYFENKNGQRWRLIPITQLDPLLFSEIARAADLLVSVAGFALSDEGCNMPVTVKDLGVHLVGQAPPPQKIPLHPTVARWLHLDRLSTLPLGDMMNNRKNILTMVFAKQIDQGKISIGERHVRVGEYSVHIATARVTKGGEPREIKPTPQGGQLIGVPWLPYDEVLLQRIVDTVVTILG